MWRVVAMMKEAGVLPPCPCASGVRWIGAMQAVQTSEPHVMTTEVKVQLCETRNVKLLGTPGKGMVDLITLEDVGSIMTRWSSTDTSRRHTCTYSGHGMGKIQNPGGHIMRTAEETGQSRELRWSAPVYFVTMAFGADAYNAIEVCQSAYGTRTGTIPGGDKLSYSLLTSNSSPRERPFTDGRMVGSWQNGPTDFVRWSICREGVACAALPPLNLPSSASAPASSAAAPGAAPGSSPATPGASPKPASAAVAPSAPTPRPPRESGGFLRP